MALRGRRSTDQDFAALYRETYSRVFNYAYYRLLDYAAAEDVVAETFCKAASAFNRFDSSRASFFTWVVAIERNCLIDYYRKNQGFVCLDDVSEAAFAVEEAYPELDETARTVHKLLEVLDEEDRELVYLKYYEEMRNTEIAQVLGMNASTVATRLSRAMARMREAGAGL